MSFPKKVKIKIAAPANSYVHDYGHTHIMTTDYFKIGINFRLPVPTDNKFECQNKSFIRLNPMAVPSFASAKVHQRMYFVPFKMVQKSFNDMIEAKPHAYDGNTSVFNIPTTFRYVSMSSIVAVLLDNNFSIVTTNSIYDFEHIDTSQTPQVSEHRNFTENGRLVYNILTQLGIKPQMSIDFDSSANLDYDVNIMPLLCLCRVFLDYYYPNNYETLSKYEIESILNSNAYGLENLSNVEIDKILRFVALHMYYDNDYFTSAWDNPIGPNTLNGTDSINIEDNTTKKITNFHLVNTAYAYSSKITTNNNDGTPIIQGDTNSASSVPSGIPTLFSQYIDNALKRVNDYVNRNRLVGSRIVDRFLARFGIKLNDEELNRTAYVGDYSYAIQFGDVMSNADTVQNGGEVLGAYAGKGIGYGESDKFEYYNKEAGMYIGITYVIPKIGYYQGWDRFALCINRFDFWTPEYDNLGVDAIAQGEIYVPNHKLSLNYDPFRQIFGYQPRYTWMKKKLDVVSGDFLFDSINVGLNAWHMMREINPNNYLDAALTKHDIKHSMKFQSTFDKAQYDRNFATSKVDNFYLINGFECKCYNKMLPIYDTYDFDSKGKEILMDVGGKISNK